MHTLFQLALQITWDTLKVISGFKYRSFESVKFHIKIQINIEDIDIKFKIVITVHVMHSDLNTLYFTVVAATERDSCCTSR